MQQTKSRMFSIQNMGYKMGFVIPADVPKNKQVLFKKNYELITRKKDALLLFAADQKIEHLNDDFYGTTIAPETSNPQHIFEIAKQAPVGALATQLGLIARYGKLYPLVNYVVKLNSKTNLIPADQDDPISEQLWSVQDVINIQKNSKLNICGVGYTIYLGSCYESTMLSQAAQIVYQAHQAGLVALLWIYPRGQFVTKQSGKLLADATGVANALGADFVKIAISEDASTNDIKQAVNAAGNTKIIAAGGSQISREKLLHSIREQSKLGISGFAIGRNLFQRSLSDAVKIAQDIYKILK